VTAITAPSAASYFRLRPNRWAPTWANLGLQDRGASLRVCPIFGEPAAEHFNLEYRVADATASPYLALGAVVWAGLDGIRQGHATAVLAASVFHFGEFTIREAKDHMVRAGLPMRLDP